ncbi:MAG: hypothetical protein AAFR83_09595 [Cyanobacteria bacterium J06629_18]
MAQSVVPKTSIPEKTWRRQTDSPFGWIAFSCGSVILHLLALWFISSYRLSVSRSASSSAVAIDFIEISPQKSSPTQPKSQPKPEPKAVSPKPAPAKPILPQNSSPVVKPSVSKVDRGAIAFDNQKIEQQLAQQQRQQDLLQQKLAEQQRQQELFQQQKLLEQQRQQELEQQRLRAEELRRRQAQQEELEARIRQQEQEQQRILDEKLRQQEIEQQRQLQAQKQQEAEQQRQLRAQQQQEQEQQRQLQAQKQQEAEQQRQLQEQQSENPDGEKILNGPQDAQGKEPPPEFDKKTAPAPIKNQSSRNSGILTASWNIDNSFTPTRDIPDKPPQLKQNISQSFIIPSSPNSNFKPVDFEVYLIINEEGYVEFAQVVDTQMRRQYQTYVDQNLLNKQLFLPANDIDPRTGEVKPRRGESRIRIKIQQAS